ncbi:MAG TPA: DJ-1/PfpI family protein [Chthoniobacterales bacterium]|jgi:transcriptional regulator GlxA family with amidase domain
MNRKRIGILGYDGVAAINVVGPLEAFSNAFQFDRGEEASHCYEVTIIACNGDHFVTDTGVTVQAQPSRPGDPPFDTIIVPGGGGMRNDKVVSQVAEWVKTNARKTRRIASVCTGVYGLAATGWLDWHRVTTHWQNALDVATRFPKLQVEESAIVVKDGKFYSAAGATAGIDLALHLINEDFGRDTAVAVARKLLVYVHRDGGQEQYSEPASAEHLVGPEVEQLHTNRMGKLVGWMNKHLGEDLRLETLAKRTLLSKHDFIHQFTHTFGIPPGLFVKNLRFNEARRRLMSGEGATAVARSVGFADPAYFIQEFRRRFGMLPSDYQRRFGSVMGEPALTKRTEFAKRNGAVIRDAAGHPRPRITSFTRCIRRHTASEAAATQAT